MLELAAFRKLSERCDLLLQNDFVYLKTYWNSQKAGFHANEENYKAGRVNLTSTCFCMLAILPNAELVKRFIVEPDAEISSSDLPMPTCVAKTLLAAPWKSEDLKEFNIYTTPIVVRTLYKVLETPGNEVCMREILADRSHKEKLKQGLNAVLDGTKTHAAVFVPYAPSAYLSFWSFRALRSEARHGLIGEGFAKECDQRAAEIASWAEAEIHRQVAYDSARDAASFDATQLAYALRLYTQDSSERKKPQNQKIIAKAIEVVASHQMPDGIWPKAHPIFHYATRGNVYTFAFELIDVILSRALPQSLFQPYVEVLERSLRWAEQNVVESDTTRGWRANYLPKGGGPEAWSTAAVLMAVRRIRSVIRWHLNDEVLDQFRASRFAHPDDSPLDPSRFYDSEVPTASQPTSLKAVLRKYLIKSHLDEQLNADRRYSAVFFGPPGTAKTTLAEAVARSLGWPYIYLQTSDFVGEGVNLAIGKARDIFSRLVLLEKAVILFDEVEEFVRDRSKEDSAQTRMITTSMLSFIQELRSKEKAIFIVATNYLDKFDAAITRAGGRFDLVLLVAPPSAAEKLRMFRDRVASNDTLKQHADDLCSTFDAFMKDEDKVVRNFAFAEWKAFIKEGLGLAGPSGNISRETWTKLLRCQEGGIAIRDDLLKAFETSKNFVRVS